MKLVRVIVWTLVSLCVIAFVFLFFLPDFGRFASLPSEHDPNLVGAWDGHFYNYYSNNRPDQKVYFFADGTGTSQGRGRFWWGSQAGEIHVKYIATDYWANRSYPYQIDASTHRVTFAVKSWAIVPKSMTRERVPNPIRTKLGLHSSDQTAMSLAQQRLNLFRAVLKQPNSGFRYGGPGSRHWVLFPSHVSYALYFVDFNTIDGTETFTRWVEGKLSPLSRIQVSTTVSDHWYDKPSFSNNRSIYLLCKELDGLPLKPRAEENDRGNDSTGPDFEIPSLLVAVELSEQPGSTTPLLVQRIEPLAGKSEIPIHVLLEGTIPVVIGENLWVTAPSKESPQP